MAGGTLIVSRVVNLHAHFKKTLEVLGFNDVTATDVDRDRLNMLINELKPKILIMGSMFYQCCTPFMTADLHKRFPKLNIAAVSISGYPDDLAMYFIINGARSYVNYWEGDVQFYKGLEAIRQGREYISPKVQSRIELRNYYPDPTGRLTSRQIEVIRLVANGFTGKEIARTLNISERTADNSKSEIYTAMNVRNENEAIRAALYMGIIKPDELHFYGRDYELKPKVDKKQKESRPANTAGRLFLHK